MTEVVSVKRENVKLNSYVKDFLNPRYIFLPIYDGFKLCVIDNAYVYKNDIVMFTKNGKSVHSSVSGRVLGVKDMLYSDGKKRPSLVVQNDFKENIRVRKSAKKYISEYDMRSFKELLDDTSVNFKGKYLIDKFNKDAKVLLINGVELEPFFGNKYFMLNDNVEEILETIDVIDGLFKYDRCILAIKNSDSEVVTKYINLLGTYPNIELKLISDEYPLGMNYLLEKSLGLKGALILDVEEIVYLYGVLKKQVPVTEKLITITGDALEPRCTFRVKIGSLLSEVFISNCDFTKEAVEVYLNGLMSGEMVDTLRYVISTDIEGIYVKTKEEKVTKECINCGLCSKCCPMGLNPKFVFDHKGIVRPEYKDSCLQCGLCNYSCPANRDLKKYMKSSDKDA